MNTRVNAAEVKALIREIERYLACVDAFRAIGSPPWPPEKPEGRKR